MSDREFKMHHPLGLEVHRGLTEREVKATLSRISLDVRDVGTGWVWYRLPTVQDCEIGIGIELGFHKGKLEEISLFHDDPQTYGTDWQNWSETKEQHRAEVTRAWLKGKGFETGSYSWGEVWASYDPKSGFGSGGVRYAV